MVYVYQTSDSKLWSREEVNFDNPCAVLIGSWSQNGKKFIIGTGSRRAFVGVKTVKNVWGVIQLGSSTRSSVSAVEFHPSGNLAAVGSIDGRIRIYSCNYSKAEKELLPYNTGEDLSYRGNFEEIDTFDERVFAFDDMQGWVLDLKFSPSGDYLFALNQNNLIRRIPINNQVRTDPGSASKKCVINWADLPLTKLAVLNDNVFFASGFAGDLVQF